MKCMTLNLRRDKGDDGANNFCHRLPLVLDAILEERPDVLALQEILPGTRHTLEEALPQYRFVGRGREADGTGEGVYIAYLHDAFFFEESGCAWLGKPDAPPGYAQPGQKYPRHAVTARLRQKGSGLVLLACTTHLDNQIDGDFRRRELETLISTLQAQRKGAPVLLMGDFNASMDNEEMTLLRLDWLSECTGHIEKSYHRFGMPLKPGKASKTDHIFLSDGWAILQKARCVSRLEKGVYLSDHDALVMEIQGVINENLNL